MLVSINHLRVTSRNDGKKASRLDVEKWVDEAWNKVTSETISNMWGSIGFQ